MSSVFKFFVLSEAYDNLNCVRLVTYLVCKSRWMHESKREEWEDGWRVCLIGPARSGGKLCNILQCLVFCLAVWVILHPNKA